MNEILYKFLPIDRLNYLEDELLRFTPPGDLNDPFECNPVPPSKDEIINLLKYLAEEQLAVFEKQNLPEKMIKHIREEFLLLLKSQIVAVKEEKLNNVSELYFDQEIRQKNNELGVFSLSRRWESTLMWSHYTNSHKGFCVGFNRNSNLFTKKIKVNESNFSIEPVEYSEDRIRIPIERGKKISTKFLLTKSIDWQYEEEERLIASLEDCDKKIKVKPFEIHLFKVPHKMIAEIIAGANIQSEDFNKIHQFCKKNNIPLYKSKISRTKFSMDRDKVI